MSENRSMLIWFGSLFLILGIIITTSIWATSTPPQTYQEAVAECQSGDALPWDASACQWQVYEKFFGTDVAKAAWADAAEKVGK